MENLSPNDSGEYRNMSAFDKSTYKTPMIEILNGVIQALGMMLGDAYPPIDNNEDIITARLVEDFLEEDAIQSALSLKQYRFIPEPAAYNAQYHQIGYLDIRVIVTHRIGAFDTTKADYIIECKRLDGKTHLNKEYVKEGICRFVEEKYTWKNVHKISAMLGYVITQTDIPNCVDAINQIGQKNNIANFTQPLTYFQIRSGFDFSFRSEHQTNSGKTAEIYHVLFDLSSKIILKN
jgi:hypothetical protein